MSDNGLTIDSLSVRIGGARIIDDLSLTVEPGQIVGLAGRNGAGKTTTLRAISALAPRTTGTITLGGVPLPKRTERVASAGVSHVPEGRGIFANLTVEQNIRLGRRGTRADPELLGRLHEKFPAVERLSHEKAGRLSGGEQQMVALVRGLVSGPKILLVDEMSLGLSPRALTTAIESLVEIGKAENIGVLVVDQNSKLLADYCDAVYLLLDGQAQLWDGSDEAASVYFG